MLQQIYRDSRIQIREKAYIFALCLLMASMLSAAFTKEAIVAPITFLIVYMITNYSNAYESKYEFTRYLICMPVQRKDLVVAKYGSVLVYLVSTLVMNTVFFLILKGLGVEVAKTLSFMAFQVSNFVITLCFMSLYLPVVYKMGFMASKWISFFMMVISMGIGTLLMGVFKGVLQEGLMANLFSLGVCGLSLVIFFVSMMLSIHIFKHKDL